VYSTLDSLPKSCDGTTTAPVGSRISIFAASLVRYTTATRPAAYASPVTFISMSLGSIGPTVPSSAMVTREAEPPLGSMTASQPFGVPVRPYTASTSWDLPTSVLPWNRYRSTRSADPLDASASMYVPGASETHASTVGSQT